VDARSYQNYLKGAVSSQPKKRWKVGGRVTVNLLMCDKEDELYNTLSKFNSFNTVQKHANPSL
jgi:hypothetical protein